MKALRNIILLTGITALSGCSAFNSFSDVDALNEVQATGNPFTQALTGEYRIFANNELESMIDYPDALHFARKGLAAATGEMVMPEPISDWNLRKSDIQQLSVARGRLIIAYDYGAREMAPAQSAKAQAAFDCWIEQQEENWDDGDAAACKSQFMETINSLENIVQAAPPSPEPTLEPETRPSPVIDASKPMVPENAVYLLFFNWNSSEISSGAEKVLQAVAEEVAKNPPSKINLLGHTDTSGSNAYNDKLALKRANNVRDALIFKGVDPNILAVNSFGENQLLVSTADNTREPANRRVNISFE